MSLSVDRSDRLLNRARSGPDDERRRLPRGSDATSHPQSFELPNGDMFDSATPVGVSAETEAAIVELEHVDTVPLPDVLKIYSEED